MLGNMQLLGDGRDAVIYYGKGANGHMFELTRTLIMYDGNQWSDKQFIKVVNKDNIAQNAKNRSSKRNVISPPTEIDILNYVMHPNISQLLHAAEDKEYLVMFTAVPCAGDLLSTSLHSPLNSVELILCMSQCAAALEYIHDKHIVHRDVKPQNISLFQAQNGNDQTLHVRLSDFGFARVCDINGRCHTLVGSREYVSPEFVHTSRGSKRGYGRKHDVWSAGITMYFAASGIMPFLEYVELDDQIVTPSDLSFNPDLPGLKPLSEYDHYVSHPRNLFGPKPFELKSKLAKGKHIPLPMELLIRKALVHNESVRATGAKWRKQLCFHIVRSEIERILV